MLKDEMIHTRAVLCQLLHEIIEMNSESFTIEDKYVYFAGEVQDIIRRYIKCCSGYADLPTLPKGNPASQESLISVKEEFQK